jgi:hypothetical protein
MTMALMHPSRFFERFFAFGVGEIGYTEGSYGIYVGKGGEVIYKA